MIAALRSEWIKSWSVRSPAVLLVVLIVSTGAFAGLFALARARQWDGGPFDPVQVSLSGILMTQVAAGALGLLAVTSETQTGLLRITLAAVPRRGRVLAAKALTVAVTALAAGTAGAFSAITAARPVLAGQGVPAAALGDPGTFRAVFGAALYLTAAALIGLSLGVITRSAAGGLTILIGGLLIVPIFVNGLPEALARWVMKFWPSTAGLRIISTTPDANLLDPLPGFAVLAGCTAILLATAFLTLRRRDV
jgi:ABC-2 type transport system permease protein